MSIRIFSDTPKQQVDLELKNGGLNASDKIASYFNQKYIHAISSDKVSQTELRRGSLYTYTYIPKYADILDFYDTNPLTIIYDSFYSKSGTYLYRGINLHFLPTRIKLQLLDAYWNYFYKFGANRLMSVLPLTYSKFFDYIFEDVNNVMYKFAIRTYIVSRIGSSIKIDDNDFGKAILVKPKFINGKTLDDIYNDYYKYNK